MVLKFITLNGENVKGYASSIEQPNEYHAVAYLADWCGHCQRFKPEWKKVIEELKGRRNMYNGYITTACDKTMEQLPFNVKPSGFPTISLYKGSKHVEDFKSERTRDNVLKFINKLKQRVKTRKQRLGKKNKKGKKAKKATKGKKGKKRKISDLMIGGGRKKKSKKRKSKKRTSKRKT
tara:strand:- start:178 stop:711 length:534 start_codon:yes stop_codon:yes gene_type:complete